MPSALFLPLFISSVLLCDHPPVDGESRCHFVFNMEHRRDGSLVDKVGLLAYMWFDTRSAAHAPCFSPRISSMRGKVPESYI